MVFSRINAVFQRWNVRNIFQQSSKALQALGTDGPTKTDEFSEKFQGGGVISNPKIYIADFGPLNRAFSAWKWYKRVFLGYVFNQFNGNTMLNCCTTCISWEIGSYNTQQSRHTEHTHFCRNFVAKSATWFSENEGGGSKAVWNFSKNSSVLEGGGFPNSSAICYRRTIFLSRI